MKGLTGVRDRATCKQYDKGSPFPSVAIGGNTKDGRPDRPEHQHQGDAPCDVGSGFAELVGQLGDGQGDGEEVKSVPGPGNEGDEEEEPLLSVELGEEFEWVGRLVHRRLQGRQSRGEVAADGHVLLGGIDFLEIGRNIADGLLVGGRHGVGQKAVVAGGGEQVEEDEDEDEGKAWSQERRRSVFECTRVGCSRTGWPCRCAS